MSNETNLPSRARRAAWPLLAALAFAACDGGAAGPEPPAEEIPDDPRPTYGDGHWSVEQRGVAIDEEDAPVIQRGASVGGGIGADRLVADFGLLVLNRPYLDHRFSACTSPGEAAAARPRARAEDVIEVLEGRGASFDRIAVNVDLLSPSRQSLLHQCFQRGSALPRFGTPEHRAEVVKAFTELASLPGLEYVTVGLDLNRYYHLRVDGSQPLVNDYTNLVTLYREVFAAIKAVNPDVRVGPGISWSTFRGRTVPEVALELGIDPGADATLAVYRAWQRTVEPLLFEVTRAGREERADFLAVSVVPAPTDAPYGGRPAPATEEGEQAVLDYYRHLPIVAGGLPVVFPQVDWPIASNGLAVQKKSFLELFKRAVSHVDVDWVAWRRLSDLTRTEGSNKCSAYTGGPIAELRHPGDYCFAGLINESGAAREVLDVLTTDPTGAPAAD